MVEGIIRLMGAEPPVAAFDLNEPVNLGNPDECTIRQLAEEVIGPCGTESRIKFCPLPQDDPKQRRPDITRARSLLGWSPEVNLRVGLSKTIDFFSQRI
ncbi:MAG: SDR family NAD-dependent epimerase/dehydratase, partial [Acidobacteriota bacterium]|nr:SDR family NAD-dependent epimerase/dehydratase [Acidobacteriota bacterium]